jgi:hypothetical protein
MLLDYEGERLATERRPAGVSFWFRADFEARFLRYSSSVIDHPRG